MMKYNIDLSDQLDLDLPRFYL